MKDTEIYDGKNFTDLLSEIHHATLNKRKKIDDLIIDLRRLIKAPEDAVVVAPIIASYLEIMVKNDDHLVKIATIIQRIMAADKGSGGGIEDILSDEDKEKLMADAMKELEDATSVLDSTSGK